MHGIHACAAQELPARGHTCSGRALAAWDNSAAHVWAVGGGRERMHDADTNEHNLRPGLQPRGCAGVLAAAAGCGGEGLLCISRYVCCTRECRRAERRPSACRCPNDPHVWRLSRDIYGATALRTNCTPHSVLGSCGNAAHVEMQHLWHSTGWG